MQPLAAEGGANHRSLPSPTTVFEPGIAAVSDVYQFEDMSRSAPGWKQEHLVLQDGFYHARVELVQMASLQLTASEVTLGRTVVGVTPRGATTFAVPVWSTGDIIYRGTEVGPLDVLATNGREQFEAVYSGATKQLIFGISQSLLERCSQALWRSGFPGAKRLAFIDDRRRGRFIETASRLLSSMLAEPQRLAGTDACVTETRFVEAWLSALRPLETAAREPSRRRVARAAQAYIDENLRERITITDLCSVTGASRRTLHQAFLEMFGMTPGTYVQRVRLVLARRMLTKRSRNVSVTAVALGCGFEHLGRFAAGYRRLFGESPTTTLRAQFG